MPRESEFYQRMYRIVLGNPQPKRVIRQLGQFRFLSYPYGKLLLLLSGQILWAKLCWAPNHSRVLHPSLIISVGDETIEGSHQASMAAENLRKDVQFMDSVLTGETSANELNN